MYKKTRRAITLIEMMIVMFLIAMIIGVVAYNYQGSLDEGKAFKTKASIEKIQTILMLKMADGDSTDVERDWETVVKQSPLVQNANSLMKDGWGEKFDVSRDHEGNIVITSKKFEEYQKKHPSSMFKNETK